MAMLMILVIAVLLNSYVAVASTTSKNQYGKKLALIHSHCSLFCKILKIRPVEHSRIQVPGKIGQIQIHAMMINVYLNGKDFDAPFRIALSQKIQKKWELVMKEIAEHVVGIMGRPKALYTVDGSKVITNSSDLEPGGMYVVVGSETGGFQHYCYGCQSRAKHPKKLPPLRKKRRRPKKKVKKEVSSVDVTHPVEGTVEVISAGDQEPQWYNKDFVPVTTSQGDMPPQSSDMTRYDELSLIKSILALPSFSTPKSVVPVEKTASGKIERVWSSPFKAVPYDSSNEYLNRESHSQINGESSFKATEVTKVLEQIYALQATDTEEETEAEMEEETEQELESEAEKIEEIEQEKDMGVEQTDPSYEEEFTNPNRASLVADMQQDSEKDEENHNDSERSATHSFHVDLSAANSEIAGPPLWTREVDSGGQLDQGERNSNEENAFVQSDKEDDRPLTEYKDEPDISALLFDDKPQSETNADVKEETKEDQTRRGSTPPAMDVNDSDASIRVTEQYVQSAEESDKALTKNNDEPAKDGYVNESLLEDKPQSNSNVEEEARDHSEQDPTPALMDIKESERVTERYVQSAEESEKALTENDDEPAKDGYMDESLSDDEPQSKTNVEEEARDHSEQDPTPAPMGINESEQVMEQHVQLTEESDKALTENNDEPAKEGYVNVSLLEDKPQSQTNVDEEARDHNEQDPIPAAMGINNSDVSEQAKQISSDSLVHVEFSRISTPLNTSEAPVEKDPSELHTDRRRSTETDIQPNR